MYRVCLARKKYIARSRVFRGGCDDVPAGPRLRACVASKAHGHRIRHDTLLGDQAVLWGPWYNPKNVLNIRAARKDFDSSCFIVISSVSHLCIAIIYTAKRLHAVPDSVYHYHKKE